MKLYIHLNEYKEEYQSETLSWSKVNAAQHKGQLQRKLLNTETIACCRVLMLLLI